MAQQNVLCFSRMQYAIWISIYNTLQYISNMFNKRNNNHNNNLVSYKNGENISTKYNCGYISVSIWSFFRAA